MGNERLAQLENECAEWRGRLAYVKPSLHANPSEVVSEAHHSSATTISLPVDPAVQVLGDQLLAVIAFKGPEILLTWSLRRLHLSKSQSLRVGFPIWVRTRSINIRFLNRFHMREFRGGDEIGEEDYLYRHHFLYYSCDQVGKIYTRWWMP
ncbi:hypothetical protein RND71_007753 [Anisodus tanguticus]|uniref:Uncharacterized protein n=1 Tax=Anisodus tanguticus TaxID=243964 RepID=A0AAE1VTB0_9SOLA|nr:hypothetical protein RND71_007753 [Anisodus tanguticus]